MIEKKQIKKSQVRGTSANEVSVRSSDCHSFLQWMDPLVKPIETFTNVCNPDSPPIQEESNIEEDELDKNVSVSLSYS